MPRDLAHLSDEAVVALVARSEDAALGELFDRYGDAAYRVARHVVRDATLAEDVVQAAFLSIWRGAGRFIPERARAGTWIMALVHRRAVDLVRREQRRRALTLDVAAEELVEDPGDEVVWLRLERERVARALGTLPDQQREVLELAYYRGFTQRELSERLGRPIGTVKSQMCTGMQRLRNALDAGGAESWKKT